jgi:ABC-type anion transport system duplicated permease subunit
VFGLTGLFFSFLNQKKPDYWISNIFLVLVTFYFFYVLITGVGDIVTEYKELFMNFKGITLLTTILPAYFQILFFTVVAPFIKEDWN